MIPQGYKKAKIRLIPEEWQVEKLEEVVEFRNGYAHEKVIIDDGKYIVINSKFISSDGKILKYTNENLCPLYKGNIVMVMSDLPKGKALAKCFFVSRNGTYTLNQRICSFKAIKAFNKFLYYFLNRNRYFLSFDNGVDQTNLRKGDVLGCPVALPPLLEQQKIAEILSTVDDYIEKTDSIIEETQQLKKGLMIRMLTKGIGKQNFKRINFNKLVVAQRGHQLKEFSKIPENWELKRCGEVFELEYGKGLKEDKRDGGEFPVVGSAGIVGYHSANITKGPGIVVGRKGGAGLAVYIEDDYWPIDTTYYVKLKLDVNLYWLFLIISLIKLPRLSEGTVPGLNRNDVYPLLIPLPPKNEQVQIVDLIQTIQTKIENEESNKAELEQLKKSLMQVLLTGQIRV